MRDVPPKAQGGVGALRRGEVERDERYHRRRTARRIDQPQLVTGRVVSEQQMRAILGIAPDELARQIREQDRGRCRHGWCRCQNDDRRQFGGAPEDRGVSGASVWVS